MNWTDERIDDLSNRVDDGFRRVDQDIRELRDEIGALRAEMNTRFDSMQRTIFQVGGGLIGTLLVGMLGLIGTQL